MTRKNHEKLLDEVSSTQLLSGDANPHGTLFAGPVHLLSICRMHETIGAHSQVRGEVWGKQSWSLSAKHHERHFGLPETPLFPAFLFKKAYRTLALKHRPDKGGDPKKLEEINRAYEVLKDP